MSFPLEELSSRAIVVRKQIVRSAISQLKAMEPSGLAGDDACLKSVWEEVCVQVQGEESPEWDVYIQAIETIVVAAAETLKPEEKCALWLYTDAGDRWLDDNLPTGISQIESLVFNIEDIANELTSHVLSAASDYETPSLYRFLHGAEDDLDAHEDEEEEASNWLDGDDIEPVEDREGSRKHNMPPQSRIASALEKISQDRDILPEHLKAILRDFLAALHENEIKAWRQEDALLHQIYWELGAEAAYHLGGVLFETMSRTESAELLTEMTFLDSSMSRYKTIVDRWLIEKECEIRDEE